jgi:hypothetical protein
MIVTTRPPRRGRRRPAFLILAGKGRLRSGAIIRLRANRTTITCGVSRLRLIGRVGGLGFADREATVR